MPCRFVYSPVVGVPVVAQVGFVVQGSRLGAVQLLSEFGNWRLLKFVRENLGSMRWSGEEQRGCVG